MGILEDGQLVHILDSEGRDQSADSSLNPGEVYGIDFIRDPSARPPHMDRILVKSMSYASALPAGFSVGDFLMNTSNTKIYRGRPEGLFGGALQWSFDGTACLNRSAFIPSSSLSLWVSDKTLTLSKYEDQKHFIYHTSPEEGLIIPYTGTRKPPASLSENTILLTCLTEWVPGEHSKDRKSFLRLLDWFL